MSTSHGLASSNIIGFITIVDVARAKAFYGGTLGLRLIAEQPPFALVFDANGIMLRLVMAQAVTPSPGTVLGWEVRDIAAVAGELERAGVQFERYPNMDQDERGIWSAPDGTRVAWFKDPDGNTLSLSEHPNPVR
jgi:catechol 2,3-dioxygenase-like lactoylglutathione lyase family enzyme